MKRPASSVTKKDADGGEEAATTQKAGNMVNLNMDSLRELQTDLWGAYVWADMHEVSTCAASKKEARNRPPTS